MSGSKRALLVIVFAALCAAPAAAQIAGHPFELSGGAGRKGAGRRGARGDGEGDHPRGNRIVLRHGGATVAPFPYKVSPCW